jgi:peptidoglycan L-alanyl-D-glutamate endopeptidase CwlK|tara:strand:+ start:3002 stop:3415 length:414 start_codon:yes stop_codon:yes gene_type:complete
MKGVDDNLVEVVNRAIEITSMDFGVTEGVRTLARQKLLLAAGATLTLDSKHIDGRAVDLVGYIGKNISWEMPVYFCIADAMRTAAIELNVSIRWGGAWQVKDIREVPDMEEAHYEYLSECIKNRRRVFIDGPHFETS